MIQVKSRTINNQGVQDFQCRKGDERYTSDTIILGIGLGTMGNDLVLQATRYISHLLSCTGNPELLDY